MPQIIKEEVGHVGYGQSQTTELVARGDESKAKVQKAIDFWYIKALDMFGRSDSERDRRYIYWGLKRRTNAQAREKFIQEVNPLIEKIGLSVPDPLKGRHYL